MNKELIKKYILREANKLATRHQDYHNNLHIAYLRNKKRIANPKDKTVKIPTYWNIDKKFNPFYVIKNAESIARSIEKKIHNNSYEPRDPYIHKIPKGNGKFRSVHVYQIPDAAISNYLYETLLKKNRHRFSSLSYAYRNDRNVHYAIQDISLDFKKNGRLFISEFDFSDFFGSINHKYLEENFNNNGFYISEFEKKLIHSFLKKNPSGIGVPQGTSVSLFLANLSCWELDRSLEAEGLRFARYADDTVIWSRSYGQICKSYNIIEDFSKKTNININLEKSAGISLLSKKGLGSEFNNRKEQVQFLGYEINLDTVKIKTKSIIRIKNHINYLLYRNLIQPINTSPFSGLTIPNRGQDPALVTAMMQIRRYLYGGLNELTLKRYLRKEISYIKFKGLMSYYPLIDDIDQLKELDRWLISSILKILRKRKIILINSKAIISSYSLFPFNLTEKNIITQCKNHKYNGKNSLASIPSFLRMYSAVKIGLAIGGIASVMNENTDEYGYDE